MQKAKNEINSHNQKNKGITIIALIITIIVMLILVLVTINVVLETGLFDKAKEGAKETEIQADREILQGAVVASLNADLDIPNVGVLQENLPDNWEATGNDGGLYTVVSPNENIFKVDNKGNIRLPIELPEGWEETAKPEEWNNNKIIAITDGENIIPLPDGYKISNVNEEQTLEKGLVIKDSKENEFVWIPVTGKFTETYSSGDNYLEPKELTDTWNNSTLVIKPKYDSQEILTELYGTKEGGNTPFYNYNTDFAYNTHYVEMVESVNKYGGFYIGRYETTIDENNEIGSKYDTTVLVSNKSIPQTNNKPIRWYGLYYTERNSNVTGNNDYIQTNMIWGQQWDAMIKYFDSRSIYYPAWGKSTQAKVVNSGKSINENEEKDEIYNIYDLRTNCYDRTAEAYSTNIRTPRGGTYKDSFSALTRYKFGDLTSATSISSSRLTLYIK